MPEYKKINCENFGDMTEISNDFCKITIPHDFGPRILGFSLERQENSKEQESRLEKYENVFYTDASKEPLGDKLDVYEDQIILYGGHRLWVSPEVLPRCYHPDNKPVSIVQTPTGSDIIGAPEEKTMIQKTISIDFAKDKPKVLITHTIKNLGLWDIEFAPWAITMLRSGGMEVLPIPHTDSGLLPYLSLSIWPYDHLGDARIILDEDLAFINQSADDDRPFKVGYNNTAGWSIYKLAHIAFAKRFGSHIEGEKYPDGGCNFETYTNDKMLEMETLGKIRIVKPGESAELKEEWALIPDLGFDIKTFEAYDGIIKTAFA